MTDQIIPGDLLARAKVITGLRQLADYLEAHPGLPVNIYGWDVQVYPGHRATEAEGRAEVDQIATALGVLADDETEDVGHYTARRSFGLVTYAAVWIPHRRRAVHEALMSYHGCITPDDHATGQAVAR
jgi:hypothetical protein